MAFWCEYYVDSVHLEDEESEWIIEVDRGEVCIECGKWMS
jgi:hypothetical protein